MSTSNVLITPTGSGEVLEAGETTATLLLAASACSSGLGVVELGFPAVFATPMHAHERVAHVWYVLSGHIHVDVGDRSLELSPGATIFIPAGTPHRLSVKRGPARVLEIDTDGGLDEYYRELARELAPGKEIDRHAVEAIQQRHATYQVGTDRMRATDGADGVKP